MNWTVNTLWFFNVHCITRNQWNLKRTFCDWHSRSKQNLSARQLFNVIVSDCYDCCCRMSIHYCNKCQQLFLSVKDQINWSKQINHYLSLKTETVWSSCYEIQKLLLICSTSDRSTAVISSLLCLSLYEWHCHLFKNSDRSLEAFTCHVSIICEEKN